MGQNNASFRGGTWEKHGKKWRETAERIRVRDGHVCRRCNRTEAQNGRKLSVDHVFPRRMFQTPELADAETNLVSLCQPCHARKTFLEEARFLKGDNIALMDFAKSVGWTLPPL